MIEKLNDALNRAKQEAQREHANVLAAKTNQKLKHMATEQR